MVDKELLFRGYALRNTVNGLINAWVVYWILGVQAGAFKKIGGVYLEVGVYLVIYDIFFLFLLLLFS